MIAPPLRHIVRMLIRIHTHGVIPQMPAHYNVELSVRFVIQELDGMLLQDFDDSRLHCARPIVVSTEKRIYIEDETDDCNVNSVCPQCLLDDAWDGR